MIPCCLPGLSEHLCGKATLYQRIFYPRKPAMRDVVSSYVLKAGVFDFRLLFPCFLPGLHLAGTEKFTDRLVSPKTSFGHVYSSTQQLPFIACLGSSIYCIVIKSYGHGNILCTS